MSLGGCGDTIPRGLCSWCACFWAQRGCFIGCQQPAVPLRAPMAPMMCHGCCCCCSLRAWLSSLGSRSHRPGLQPAAAARSLARGDYGTDSHEGVTLLRCLLGILVFFSTTASVTVTPEWLRSGSECRDERRILKWPRTPCSQQKQLWCKPVLCWGFWGGEKKRRRRNTWYIISDVVMEKKNYFQLQSGRSLCRAFWGTSSCPLSALCFSFPANIPDPGFLPGSTESRLSAICLSAEGCFCQFYTRSSVSQSWGGFRRPQVLLDSFFPPLACMLPKMSGNPSRDEHCNSNFWRAFFSYFYTYFLSLVVAESLQVFITASAIRFLCSSSQPLHDAGKLRQSVECKYRTGQMK